MSTKTEQPQQREDSASWAFPVSLVILVSAVFIGASCGFLLADRADLTGQFKVAVARFIAKASRYVPETEKPEDRNATKPAMQVLSEQPLPAPSSIGAIHCSQERDSAATVDIEVGTMALVRAERLHDPERVFFDLSNDGQAEAPREKMLGTKTFSVDGPLVSRVRLAQWASGVARIVLDLKCDCEYSYRISSGPSSRLIVEVHPAGLAAFVSKM